MHEPGAEIWPAAFCRRITEVLARREEPWVRDRLRKALLEVVSRCAVLQPALEDQRFDGRNGHPLAVDRVEAARRIPEDDEAFGPARQVIEVPELVLRSAIGTDRRRWLGVADRLVQDRRTNAPGELQKAGLVGRRVVAADAGEGEVPLIVIDGKEPATPGALRRGLEEQSPPLALDRWIPRVGPARIAEERVDDGLPRRAAAQLLEPGRSLRASAAGVDDEPGFEIVLGAVVARSDPHARDGA